MKSNKLMDAITNLEDDLLDEARKEPTAADKKAAERSRFFLSPSVLRAVCAVLAAGILAGSLLLLKRPGRYNQGTECVTQEQSVTDSAEAVSSIPETTASRPVVGNEWQKSALASPEYPEEWTREEREAHYLEAMISNPGKDPQKDDPTRIRRAAAGEAAQTWRSFFADMMLLLLSEETKNNAVMSPVNLFMVTAMLAEITAGETRQEILDALSVDSIETLREQARKIWELCYFDDGYEKTVLGNSLWLSDICSYKEETVQTVAKNYYASVFSGDMTSPEYSQLLRDWTDQMTGGFLKEQTERMKFDPDTVLELVSTVFCQSDWTEAFEQDKTTQRIFHGSQGDRQVDFMHGTAESYYLVGESFTAVQKTTAQGKVWFVLPNEDYTLEEMMQEKTFQGFLAYSDLFSGTTGSPDNIGVPGIRQLSANIKLTLPKLDISTNNQDLKESLQKLNIHRCFDPDQADFSAISETHCLCVGKAEQSSRLKIDENGMTAASFAEVGVVYGGLPPVTLNIVLNRPFFVLVTDYGSIPLFAAVVNEP